MRRSLITGLVASLFVFTVLGTAFAIQILPEPTSDRTFQFLRIEETFKGSPLKVKALVPNAVIVIGSAEDPALMKQAGAIAFMLGQWAHDPGSSVERIRQNATLAPIMLDSEVTEKVISEFNLIVLGSKNRIYGKIKSRLHGKGSFIEVIRDVLVKGRDVMFVSDSKAAFYLANRRLYFKSGAYNGYFNFVKARLLIEKGDLDAAKYLLTSPNAVKGCGKPVMLAIGFREKLPKGLLALAKKRNVLVFKELNKALTEKNANKAKEVWHRAMTTCYACHQGIDNTKKFRKFTPDSGVHSYHQNIVRSFGENCSLCHYGRTVYRGYVN